MYYKSFLGIGKRKIWGSGQLAIPGYNAKEGALPKTFTTDYWTEERTNAFYPRAWDLGGSNTGFAMQKQSRYLLDMSYLRIKNITLGYTLPKSITTKWHLNKFRVYIAAQNLFTLTKYSGYDPEIGGNISTRGMDMGNYPSFTTYSAGINLSF